MYSGPDALKNCFSPLIFICHSLTVCANCLVSRLMLRHDLILSMSIVVIYFSFLVEVVEGKNWDFDTNVVSAKADLGTCLA